MEKEYIVARKQYINEIKNRGSAVACNVPFMSDSDWKQAVELVHKRGPLSPVDQILYKQQHDHFALSHFLDLVFELELAYGTIKDLSHE